MDTLRRGSQFTFKATIQGAPTGSPVITFVQDGYTILEKRGNDIGRVDRVEMIPRPADSPGDPIAVAYSDFTTPISEEESFMFRKGYCNVQMRFKHNASNAFPTNIAFFEVKDSLSEEVLNEPVYY